MKGFMKVTAKDIEHEGKQASNITVETQIMECSVGDRIRLMAAVAEALDFGADELLAAALTIREHWDDMADEKIRVNL